MLGICTRSTAASQHPRYVPSFTFKLTYELIYVSSLEMVEPVEETRGEVIFATEPLLSSLSLAIPGTSRSKALGELDEVEVGARRPF